MWEQLLYLVVGIEVAVQWRDVDNMKDIFVEESVGDGNVVKMWAVPHEFVRKVVFVVDDPVGNATFGVCRQHGS